MAEKFQYAYSLGRSGETPVVRKLPVAATQTLVKGDAVIMSSGKIAIAGGTAGTLVGVMMQDSDGAAADTLVEVALAQPWHVWRATADADATAIVRNGTRSYDLNTTTQTVAVSDSTGGSLQVVDIDGDDNTAVHVQFTVCFFE